MKEPRVVAVTQQKPYAGMLNEREAENKKAKEKAKRKKDSNAPKSPPSPFLLFMEDFRKSFKENYPDNKSVAVVGSNGNRCPLL